MFTYERASVFTQLMEAIILYEAIKNRRQQTPDDKNVIRHYNELRHNVEFWTRRLLDDGYYKTDIPSK